MAFKSKFTKHYFSQIFSLFPEKIRLDLVEKGKPSDSYPAVRLIVEDIRRTAEYASDIAEMVLNMTVEQSEGKSN